MVEPVAECPPTVLPSDEELQMQAEDEFLRSWANWKQLSKSVVQGHREGCERLDSFR
eukprot:m.6608 g.6608  ORF g.6608 m.6608 type:complete len:57 (-) comp3864_c0_seq1:486-656(-)